MSTCLTCYHYQDHDGYREPDCAVLRYDPDTFLHGEDGKNRPLPRNLICPQYRDRMRTYAIRESRSIIQQAIKDLPKLTEDDLLTLYQATMKNVTRRILDEQ